MLEDEWVGMQRRIFLRCGLYTTTCWTQDGLDDLEHAPYVRITEGCSGDFQLKIIRLQASTILSAQPTTDGGARGSLSTTMGSGAHHSMTTIERTEERRISSAT